MEDSRNGYISSNKVLREDPVIVRAKPPANNKPCPCGSKLKYKRCCKIIERKKERDNAKVQESVSSEVMAASSEMALLYI